MRPRPLILICLASLLLPGCAIHQLKDDQDKIRTVLVDLYTNQVMDNLVRAVNGLPIIQLDYTNANSQVTVGVNASLSDGLATSHANTLTAVALKSVLVARNLGNNLGGGGGSTRTNLVAVTATPVTTSNEVYDAYLRFLAEPGTLQISDCPPPHGAAHVCVRFEKKYYWVPVEFRQLFFNLASITSTQRGQSLLPPAEFYTASLNAFADPPTPQQFKALVQLRLERLKENVRKDAVKHLEDKIKATAGVDQMADYLNHAVAKEQRWLTDEDAAPILGGRDGDDFILQIRFDRSFPVDTGSVQFGDGPWQAGSAPRMAPLSFDSSRSYKSNEFFLTLNLVQLPPEWKSLQTMTFPLNAAQRKSVEKAIFPIRVKLKLDHNPPYEQPSTKELLDQIPFTTPQISLDPNADSTPARAELSRPTFLQPVGLANKK